MTSQEAHGHTVMHLAIRCVDRIRMGIVTDLQQLTTGVEVMPCGQRACDQQGWTGAVRLAPQRVHQRCVIELTKRLDDYLECSRLGVVITAPAALAFNERVVSPDVGVVVADDGCVSRSWRASDRLLLAAEVVSPETARDDRLGKRLLYLAMGAPYW